MNDIDGSGKGETCDACKARTAAASYASMRCIAAAKTPAAVLACNVMRVGCAPVCAIAMWADDDCALFENDPKQEPEVASGTVDPVWSQRRWRWHE